MDDDPLHYDVSDLYAAGDCDEALHRLYHYLDGELTQDRRDAISRHLSQCSHCLHAFDFEAELKVVIARSCRDQVPESLKEKISRALHDASRTERGSV
jgi:anti-sigma factor (TIGR02949 family)